MSQVFWSPGSFGGGSGGGGVSGPGSSTNNSIATFNGTAGDTIQSSFVTIDSTTGIIQATRSIASANQCFFEIENTNAGASADAGFQSVTVGGDPYFSLANATCSWSVFADTSDSNTLKIQEGANLFFSVTQAGVIELGETGFTGRHVVNAGELELTSAANQLVQLEIRASGTGNALLDVVSTGTGDSQITVFSANGDSVLHFRDTGGGQSYYMGIDESDSQQFKIVPDSGFGAAEAFQMSTSGVLALGVSGAGQTHRLNTATSTSATAGSNGDVPAQVDGYIDVNINGTIKKVPYYNS